MTTFFRYLIGTIFLPRRALGCLMAEPRPLKRGARAVILAGSLFLLTTAVFAVSGAVPMAPVFLPIRLENYHFWQMFFVLPLFISPWILASVLVHLLGGGGRKEGSLKRTLTVFGFSLAGPVILLWLPQAVIAFFYALGMGQQKMVDILSGPGPAQVLYIAAHILALLWIYGLCCAAACVSQRVNRGKGLLFGSLAGTIYAAAVIIFLR